MTAAVSLRDIAVRRGRRGVLSIPTLDLRRGEVLAVLGPNGAGKTTLLQVMALLLRPSRGEVLYGDISAARRQIALRRRTAVCFQSPLLLDMSVLDNVCLGPSFRGIPSRQRRERAQRWLERFGIGDLAGRSPRTLSGGEAQRVNLARAFVLEPQALFLDEPFSALDQPTREGLLEDLAGVLRETGVSTLFVTHDRDEAARLADRVAVLIEGRLRQVGPVAEVFAAPSDEDVAAFVGVETVVPARVLRAGEGMVELEVPGGGHVECLCEATGIGRALVCLRPEDVALALPHEGGAPDSVRNHLRGRVATLRPVGLAGVRVTVDCGFPLVALVTRRSAEGLALTPGSEVVASFKATAAHLIALERESGDAA